MWQRKAPVIPKPTYQRLLNISLKTKSPDEFFDQLLELRNIVFDSFLFEALYDNNPKKLNEIHQGELLFDRNRTFWHDPVCKAWEYLGGDFHRSRALECLQHSVREFLEQGYESLSLLVTARRKRKRQTQIQGLQNVSQQAVDETNVIINKWLDSAKALGVPQQVCEEISRSLDNSIRKQFSHLIEGTGFSTNNLQKRERKEKPILNATILELEAMFQERLSSRHKAQEYTHCLVHIAGVWLDSEAHGLSAKISQLYRRLGGLPVMVWCSSPSNAEFINKGIKLAMTKIGSDDPGEALIYIIEHYLRAKNTPLIETSKG